MRITKKGHEELEKYERHEKKWGDELWIENSEYCGKLLRMWHGHATSMHFHVSKLETMYVFGGMVALDLIDPENAEQYTILLERGDSIQIPRYQPHSIRAIRDSVVIEFSTHHFDDDSYRVTTSS